MDWYMWLAKRLITMKKRKNSKGFTLIEVLIASGIFTVFTVALSSTLLYFGGSIRKIEYDIDMEQSFNLIRKIMKQNKLACTETLKGISANSGNLTGIKNKEGSIVFKAEPSVKDKKIILTGSPLVKFLIRVPYI